MNNVWKVDVKNKKILPCDEVFKSIKWHKSVFKGYGEGIIDCGGSKELSDLSAWNETKNIHGFIKQDPNLFFNTPSAIWCYTGKVGEAADFIGFRDDSVLVGEIKWQEGWSKRLSEQVPRYISKQQWLGDTSNKHLEVYVSSPQTASKDLITNLSYLNSSQWKSLKIYFGFMQLGWLEEDNKSYFFRVIWMPGDSWIGKNFDRMEEIGIH
ncbi:MULTISPECIES: hypothetical protein [unclassified Endozoicomonas]|uniref:hypothetical protein n=1 Tax=unclassified Endozoicomonas TaxID=2644528 RepID=UPI003BB69A2A